MVPDLQNMILNIVGIVAALLGVSSVALAFLSYRKGYDWFWWVGALGPIGLITLSTLPKIENSSPDNHQANRGNTIGKALSLTGLVGVIVFLPMLVIFPFLTQPSFVVDQIMQLLVRYAISNVPILFIFTGAIVVGAINLNRHPRASKWLITGGVIGILQSVLQIIIYATPPYFLSPALSRSSSNYLFIFVGLVFNSLEASAIGLLVVAAVLDRSSKPANSFSKVNKSPPPPPDIRII